MHDTIITSAISACIPGLLLALWWIFTGDRIRKLPDRVDHLEDERLTSYDRQLGELKTMVNAHIAADQSQAIMTLLTEQKGQLSRIFTKLDNIAETTAAQAANITGNRESIKRMDRTLQTHLEVSRS